MGGLRRQQYIVGVDLGGTKLILGAMPADGSRMIAVQSGPTGAELGGEAVLADRMAGTGASRDDFIGIGIGAPGPLDRERGLVIVAPNLGWRDFPLRDRISKRLGMPATLDNDANCATVGEWWQGAARGGRN